ncbi:hypothetical protein L1987_35140 [Smallanthus sonchifolius]|uniref:Uncharacterized protein n=1 Tax=Smallanthus sonchifolius TaxID=185202 RepID=A0ACB9HWJ2_9ASTR|nr:hypothetical protein L1987_35140 [Smallanthus sonchifolius]
MRSDKGPWKDPHVTKIFLLNDTDTFNHSTQVKVCSGINKPNGLLPKDWAAIMTFISSLPIRKIRGIGKVTEHILKHVFEIMVAFINKVDQMGTNPWKFLTQIWKKFRLQIPIALIWQQKSDEPIYIFC